MIAMDEQELIRLAQKGDGHARDQLIVQNWPLACWYGLREYHKRGHCCQPLLDKDDFKLICGLGVVVAIDKCVVEKLRGKFFSYAKFWCQNFLDKAIADAPLVHVGRTTMFHYRRGTLSERGRRDVDDILKRELTRDTHRAVDRRLGPVEEAILNEGEMR